MADYDFDLFVIGGGSGGVRAARIAAGHGARVAIAEEYRFGGTCVIRGCVPKKLLVYASHFHAEREEAAFYGWETGPARFSWPRLIANKDKEIARLEGLYRKGQEGAGVAIFDSRAVLVDPHTVQVTGKRVTAGRILLATGGHPFKPQIPGAELMITSDEAFHLPDLPRRILVLGGGYIAVEFAGIFNGMGAETVLAYRGEQILRGFDDDIRSHLHGELKKGHLEIRLQADPARVDRAGDALKVTFTDGRTLETDLVMAATGRRPNTSGLGLDAAGIACAESGAVIVDAYSRTNVPSVFAVGDVTDRVNLTPVAIREGHAFADTEFGGMDRKADHDNVPSAVFSQPSVGSVGLTEAEARKRYARLDIYRSTFTPMKNTLTGMAQKTLMKLIVDTQTDRVLGCHMVGPDAAEIVQGLAIGIKMGATKADFDATVAIHPSAAEEFVTMRNKETVSTAQAAAD
ncbi:MAG: glutathione-disulfide reductase [Sneathiellaceae bacterium]